MIKGSPYIRLKAYSLQFLVLVFGKGVAKRDLDDDALNLSS